MANSLAASNSSEGLHDHALEEVFGEAAGNWSTLAFSEKKLPGQHK